MQYKLIDFGESTEAVARGCSVKKMFLKIELRPSTVLKKRLWHRCFPMNFAKFLRTPFLIERLWWLLLNQDHWFVKQELFERDEPNICNVAHCFLWYQSSFQISHETSKGRRFTESRFFLTVTSPSTYYLHGYIKPFLLKWYLVISGTTCWRDFLNY